MYRLLLLFFLIGLGESWSLSGYRYSYRPKRWHYNKYDRRFSSLANHVIEADRALQGFCRQNANCNVREVYDDAAYKLVYSIPKCSVDYISVKIKHRVLYMSAQQVAIFNPKTYVDMRILPDLLKINDATWTYDASHYDAGKLEINIPYKVNFKNEFEATCGEINTRIIRVRRLRNQLGNRFGEDANEEDDGDYEDETDIYDTTTISPDENNPISSTSATLVNVTAESTSNSDGGRLIFSS